MKLDIQMQAPDIKSGTSLNMTLEIINCPPWQPQTLSKQQVNPLKNTILEKEKSKSDAVTNKPNTVEPCKDSFQPL